MYIGFFLFSFLLSYTENICCNFFHKLIFSNKYYLLEPTVCCKLPELLILKIKIICIAQ